MSFANVLVHNTTRELTPADLRLPSIVWSVFTAMNKLHGLWRWYRRYDLYTNPNNFAQLIAGHAVNFVIGDSVLLRIAAQCVLISTRILQCVEQQESLCREGRKWWDAVQGKYPDPIRCQWTKGETVWLSPSSAHWWKANLKDFFAKMNRIFWSTTRIVTKTIKLSMKVMDAIDSFSLSPETRDEGINEFFVNTMKWLDTLVEKKETLLQGMIDNRIVIERILKGSPFTYEQLLKTVEGALKKTEAVYEKAQKVSKFGNGIIIDWGKIALNSLMVVTGFSKCRPTVLARHG